MQTSLDVLTKTYAATVMSSTPTQNLCSPNSVPTYIPGANMENEWCATPEQGNATAKVMEQCCTSDEVFSIGGCAMCYMQDSTAEDQQAFNHNFNQCLMNGVGHQNASVQRAVYCNTPSFSSTASTRKTSSWTTLSVVFMAGLSSVLQVLV